jgi:uncharacterized membrane protein YjfL (UPF0719 family)
MGVGVLILSKFALDMLTPYKIDNELTKADNPALGVTVAAYYASVVIVFLGATIGDNNLELNNFGIIMKVVGDDLGYALFGIFALNVCRKLVDATILHTFSTVKEIITDHNVGTGAVEAGAMIATALLIAGSINGEGSFFTTLVFFGLGMALLILFSHFHILLTPYDDHDEIEKDNVAAGAYLGFSLIALGIIVLKAIAGDFISWKSGFAYFFVYAAIGFVGLALLQKAIFLLFLPGSDLNEEICRDRNLNVAWIGGSLSIGMAAIIFFML